MPVQITITTFRLSTDPTKSMDLVQQRKFGNIPEALRMWMNAQLDFSIDRIRIEVEKVP